jgi:hypothetical protein
MVIISVALTIVVIHTVVVEPQTTLHARRGEAGEVEVDPTNRTVWILRKGQCVHIGEEVTSLMCAGHSRERYGVSKDGVVMHLAWAWAGHSHG